MAVTIVTSACPALALEQARLRFPLASIYDYDTIMHGLNSRARTKVKRKLAADIKKEIVVGSHDVVLVLRSDVRVEDILGDALDANILHVRKQRSDKGLRKDNIDEGSISTGNEQDSGSGVGR